MKKIILLLSLLLTGCGIVHDKTIQQGIEVCKPNGGLRYIWSFKATEVRCNNGASFGTKDWE